MKKTSHCIDCGKLIWSCSVRCNKCKPLEVAKKRRQNRQKQIKSKFGISTKKLFQQHIKEKTLTNHQFCKKIGIHLETFYKWQREFGLQGIGAGHSRIGQKRSWDTRCNKGQIPPIGHKVKHGRYYYLKVTQGNSHNLHSHHGNYQLEHRYIIEHHLGRKLKKGEIVHHIDGDGLNNTIDNLIVITLKQHSLLGRIIHNIDKSFAQCIVETLTARYPNLTDTN